MEERSGAGLTVQVYETIGPDELEPYIRCAKQDGAK
jgi:hypothetical protein